jgi:hypothetical protein
MYAPFGPRERDSATINNASLYTSERSLMEDTRLGHTCSARASVGGGSFSSKNKAPDRAEASESLKILRPSRPLFSAWSGAVVVVRTRANVALARWVARGIAFLRTGHAGSGGRARAGHTRFCFGAGTGGTGANVAFARCAGSWCRLSCSDPCCSEKRGHDDSGYCKFRSHDEFPHRFISDAGIETCDRVLCSGGFKHFGIMLHRRRLRLMTTSVDNASTLSEI